MFTCSFLQLEFLLCLMKINLVFCSLCSISSFLVYMFFSFLFSLLSFFLSIQRTTTTNAVHIRFFSDINSQENSEFLHLNQNQLHQSSVNVGFSNIAYNPDSSRSDEVEEGTSTEKG